MFDLTGKTALVTGASGGIGGAIAKALHGAGATVGLSGTRVDPLEALKAVLGDRAHVLPCNLSDPDEVDALPKAAIEAMGGVSILVNNAGITRDQLFMRMSDEEWASVIDVNLTATMRLCRGVMRPMMKSIAYEVASRGITANAVAPGMIGTAMTDKLTDDQKEKINAQIPLARMGTPEEIAAAVLYLASEEGGYVTGTTLHVNGGMAML